MYIYVLDYFNRHGHNLWISIPSGRQSALPVVFIYADIPLAPHFMFHILFHCLVKSHNCFPSSPAFTSPNIFPVYLFNDSLIYNKRSLTLFSCVPLQSKLVKSLLKASKRLVFLWGTHLPFVSQATSESSLSGSRMGHMELGSKPQVVPGETQLCRGASVGLWGEAGVQMGIFRI